MTDTVLNPASKDYQCDCQQKDLNARSKLDQLRLASEFQDATPTFQQQSKETDTLRFQVIEQPMRRLR
jgi:hypothetical protein